MFFEGFHVWTAQVSSKGCTNDCSQSYVTGFLSKHPRVGRVFGNDAHIRQIEIAQKFNCNDGFELQVPGCQTTERQKSETSRRQAYDDPQTAFDFVTNLFVF